MQNVKLLPTGADIEFFVQNIETKEIISGEGLIPGNKHNPFVFDDTNKYFAVSLDNVLAEICIPPAKNAEEFYKNIEKSRNFIDSYLPPGYCTKATPSALLDPVWLDTEQALVFGCEPDYSAYTMYRNQSPRYNNPNLRSAGMHVHIGIENPEPFDEQNLFYKPTKLYADIVKAMDLHLGVPSILTDPDNLRRKLYGKAGSFRPKPYGLEYRTLSNHFVSDKGKIEWVYASTQRAIDWLNNGNIISKQLSDLIRIAIDENNVEQAELLVKNFKVVLP